MDILTQGLLGATVAQSGTRKTETKLATLVGFLTGLLADADVLIRSAQDTLYTIEYHRHFTHSLIFIPVGALIAATLLWPFIKQRLPFKQLYIYCLLGYLLSGTLDAFTSFGTYLFWPFSNERVAWHLVSIVDPVITLILLIAIVLGIRRDNATAARIALLICGCYLLINALQLQRVESFIKDVAAQRGHNIERIVVKPSLGNNVLWRSTYIDNNMIYIDAVRATPTAIKHYPGGVISQIQDEDIKSRFTADSILYKDITRFKYFSDDYIAWHPQNDNVIGDVRYAMLPDSVTPLWGIKLDADQSDKHVEFVTFRNNNSQSRERFWKMLTGQDVAQLSN